jgi:hemoglobin-like flavoprotein
LDLINLINQATRFAVSAQVKEDVYEKIDKELLEFIEDVLLNRWDACSDQSDVCTS